MVLVVGMTAININLAANQRLTNPIASITVRHRIYWWVSTEYPAPGLNN